MYPVPADKTLTDATDPLGLSTTFPTFAPDGLTNLILGTASYPAPLYSTVKVSTCPVESTVATALAAMPPTAVGG